MECGLFSQTQIVITATDQSNNVNNCTIQLNRGTLEC